MRRILSLALCAGMLAGCAGGFTRYNTLTYPPLRELDRHTTEPAATAYNEIVPAPVRRRISDLLDIADVLLDSLYALAQLNPDLAFGNIVWSVTDGIAKLVVGEETNIAGQIGIQRYRTSAGATLALYGIPGGGCIVTLLGPMELRDIIGTLPLLYFSPNILVFGRKGEAIRFVVNMLNTRAQHIDDLRNLEKTALDPPAQICSIHQQRRALEILAAKRLPPSGTTVPPDFYKGS